MENVKIERIVRDDNVVKVLVAQSNNEKIDSEVRANWEATIKMLAENPNPHNRYLMAQLIGYAVTDYLQPRTDFLDRIADTKRTAAGDHPVFKAELEGVHAYIQALDATTPRSRMASKNVILDTVAVSARPAVNYSELIRNVANLPKMVVRAGIEMENAMLGYIGNVLDSQYNATAMATPYYVSGAGVNAQLLDPVVQFWARMGGATILGDIAQTSELAALTGFATVNSPATVQFANGIIEEQNMFGFIGRYKGQDVVTLANPYLAGTDTPALSTKNLYILPRAVDPEMRPLKIHIAGDVVSMEGQNIDDKTWEVRLDQEFGAGIVYGDRPYMSVFHDTRA